MYSKCPNCELFMKQEEDRIDWYNTLTLKNIELLKKLSEQDDVITILKMKLLEKRAGFLAKCVGNFEETSPSSDNESGESFRNSQQALLAAKIEEATLLLEVINKERESFEKEMEEKEEKFSEHISYFNGMIDYYRKSLFEELRKSNQLKQHFLQKNSDLIEMSQQTMIEVLKQEGERLDKELRSRYKGTILKCKQEIEGQVELVSRLRKHNKELYLHIHKIKKDNENKILNFQRKISDLQTSLKRMKERNDYLHTQIKLEVEGCQTDIQDARKTIRKLTKPKTQS